MSRTPLVYTVVVNWNGKDVTIECLQSLLKAAYPNNHLLVVDNASTDGSAEAIRERFPEVEILRADRNLRFSGGNNLGIRHALRQGAELLLLMNNDTTVHPDFLTHLVSRILSTDRAGMVAPKILYAKDPSKIWFAGGEISFWTGTMRHTGIREPDSGTYDAVRDIDYATGCCVLVTRKMVEEVGLLDESYFMYGEDADWSMRTRKAGYRILFEPQARIWHKVSVAAGGHLSWYKLKNKFLSNLRFFAKYSAWYQWLVFPWLSVVINTVLALKQFTGHGTHSPDAITSKRNPEKNT